MYRFADERDRDRIQQLADELEIPLEKVFFYYVQWLEETRNIPMPQDLAEFKDLPELQLDATEKLKLWEKFTEMLMVAIPLS